MVKAPPLLLLVTTPHQEKGNRDYDRHQMYPEIASIQRFESGGFHVQGDQEIGDTSHAAQERLPMPGMWAAMQDRAGIAGGSIMA
jgi:hypothetical protein